MHKSYVNAKIKKIHENGITVITIQGLDEDPKAYKMAYLHILKEIELQKFRLMTAGIATPVVRVLPSLEIH